jgi:hypothetical protein
MIVLPTCVRNGFYFLAGVYAVSRAKSKPAKPQVCTDVRECAEEVFRQLSTPGYGIDSIRYPDALRSKAKALLVHEGRIRYCFARGHHVPYDAPHYGAQSSAGSAPRGRRSFGQRA